jgi:hypothetical protein
MAPWLLGEDKGGAGRLKGFNAAHGTFGAWTDEGLLLALHASATLRACLSPLLHIGGTGKPQAGASLRWSAVPSLNRNFSRIRFHATHKQMGASLQIEQHALVHTATQKSSVVWGPAQSVRYAAGGGRWSMILSAMGFCSPTRSD